MKTKILLHLVVLIALSSYAQKQFTHTAAKENISCNYDCTLLDVPELNNNPGAIILVSPIMEKGVNLNPHPIGVYYFKNQWSIFNLNGKAIPAGAKFMVEYVTSPDKNHFQYSIARENLQKDGSAFIDHPALNNNPTIKFISFLSWNPDAQGATTNKNEATMQYNNAAGKWFISNINSKPLYARVAYNIVVSSGGNTNTNPVYPSVVIPELVVTPSNSNSTPGPVIQMYMTAWANGIKLPGDNIRSAYLDKTQILGFEMGVSSLSSSGQVSASGKRVYDPVTIKSRTGYPATIPLFDAFVKNQNMAITIETYSFSATGTEALNYSIKLTGARIASFKQIYDEAGLNGTGTSAGLKKFFDEIKVTFTGIEFLGAYIAGDQMKTGD